MYCRAAPGQPRGRPCGFGRRAQLRRLKGAIRMSRRDSGARAALAVVLAAVLAACGSGGDATSAKPGGMTPAQNAKKSAEAQRLSRDMVAAVSSGKSHGPVDLKFALSERPRVGQPLDIQLAVIPSIELERLLARFQASEGLELVNGAEVGPLQRLAAGVALSHTITVVPKSDGIFYITATVLADSATDSVSRSFSIPLIAGSGLPAPDSAPVAATKRAPRRGAAP
jgi:hypothetical protein